MVSLADEEKVRAVVVSTKRRYEIMARLLKMTVRCTALAFALTGGTAFSNQPEGTEWRLVEVGGSAAAPPAGDKLPSLMLDAAQKKAAGFAGCNSFFGSYTLEGSALKFGPVGMTRKACPDLETGLENAFLKALERTLAWKIRDGALLLMTGDEVLARFEAGKGDNAAADPGSMTYRSKQSPSGMVTLSRGEYRAPAAPGSASEFIVMLTDKKAFGRVRGRETGAVILVTSAGGSGSFYELALLSHGAKGWENTDTILLGDRVKVHSVVIESDHIIVHMTTHGPDDPLCCPTREETKRFSVQDDRLVPVAERKAGGDPQIIGAVWQWAQTIYNNDTRAVPAKPESYTVRFLENGDIEVKADCNRKSGTYSVDGRKLSIRITHSTMAACEQGSLEDQFVRDLSGGAGFFLKDGDLFIDLTYDTGTMRFTRKRGRTAVKSADILPVHSLTTFHPSSIFQSSCIVKGFSSISPPVNPYFTDACSPSGSRCCRQEKTFPGGPESAKEVRDEEDRDEPGAAAPRRDP